LRVHGRLPSPLEEPAVTAYFFELVGQENVIAGTDCDPGGRVHPQIARVKLRSLREGVALVRKKLLSRISKILCGDEKMKKPFGLKKAPLRY
jgi:hypothetical protein